MKRKLIPYAGYEDPDERKRSEKPKGERDRRAWVDKNQIRRLNEAGVMRIEIAKRVGCHPSSVTRVLDGR